MNIILKHSKKKYKLSKYTKRNNYKLDIELYINK